MSVAARTCFLLNYSYRDRNNRFEISLFAKSADGGPVKIVINSFRPLFFIPRTVPLTETALAAERKALPLKSMIDGLPVDCLYFATQTAFLECGKFLRGKGIRLFESDVNPVERYLMERFVQGGFEATGQWRSEGGLLVCQNPRIRSAPAVPGLVILSIDIETNATTGEILSIACSGQKDRVFIRGDATAPPPVFFCGSERELLVRFFDYLRMQDPDILIGWNVADFDLQVIHDRCNTFRIPFSLGRSEGSRIIPTSNNNRKIVRIPGRVVLDVPSMLRAYYRPFDEYSLDHVAQTMLGKGKLIRETGRAKIDEIIRQFQEDPLELARYNLNDAVLTKDIFNLAGILPNIVERSKRSGHLIDRLGGSVAAFDYLYLPRLHRAGFVAPDAADIPTPSSPLPGGYVLEPKPGIYENVLALDFRSLYPSLIMTFKIDPLGLLLPASKRTRGPGAASFADEAAILPVIISELMTARARAKSDNNPFLSQAIKILMNSFYGVLGANGCRFFSPEIAATITRTGQYILKTTIEHIQSATPFPVIYGDTDSLFVCLGKGKENDALETGRSIAQEVTSWLASELAGRFEVSSALELQFERCFRHFFMPSLRGSTQGSKKHYCGTTIDTEGNSAIVFKGMESARSDWTPLAKEFQHGLFDRLFTGKPLDKYIIATVEKVRSGAADAGLEYRKHLRKRLDEYTEHVQPHVQAARLLDNPGPVIRYYMTTSGPQPRERRTSPLDYEHYVEAQLKPVADSILEQLGTSFDKIVSGQQELFGQ